METLGTVLAWIVFGLVVGFIARGVYPGRQALSLPNTVALGITGSMVGGLIAWALGNRPEDGAFHGAGWILSIVGALLVVWGVSFMTRKSA